MNTSVIGLVGTVSHRPFPRLPGELEKARETRSLPWRWQLGMACQFGRDGVSLGVLERRAVGKMRGTPCRGTRPTG